MSLLEPTAEKINKWTAERNVKKLLDALGAKDAAIQRLAVEGLSRVRGPEVFDYCRKNAKSEDRTVRWQVTQILGLIGTPDAMKILEAVDDPTEALEQTLKGRYKDYQP
jgi:HEAT repeat protein